MAEMIVLLEDGIRNGTIFDTKKEIKKMKKTVLCTFSLLLLTQLIPAVIAAPIEIGWSEADITPPLTKRIPLMGQYYQRLADEKDPIHSRIKIVILALRQGREHVLMGSLDHVLVWQPFVDRLRVRIHEIEPEINTNAVYMGGIHTHSAPAFWWAWTPEGDETARKEPDVLGATEYAESELEPIAMAYVEAWRRLSPGGIMRAFGTARVGHCRLASFADGSTEMYGDTSRPDFTRLLEGEDNGVEMLFTVDAEGRRTGLVLNVACPSQVLEANYQISSDFAGATREKLKGIYGNDFKTLYQVGSAGCQSPRDLVRRGHTEPDGWHEDMVELLSDRLVNCVTAAKPAAVEREPALRHERLDLALPMRRVTPEQIAESRKTLAELGRKWPDDTAWDDFLAETHRNEKKGGPGPYDSKLHPYAVMAVHKAVLSRAAEQDTVRTLPVELHVTRIGDVAMFTCPFELYLAYGQTIKARSAAKQTFVVSMCGYEGYLPTRASEETIGYSGGINVGKIGHEGGYRMCDAAVEAISRLFRP